MWFSNSGESREGDVTLISMCLKSATRFRASWAGLLLAGVQALATGTAAWASTPAAGGPSVPVGRVIVQYKVGPTDATAWAAGRSTASVHERLQSLALRHALTLKPGRVLGPRTQAVDAAGVTTAELLQRLRADPQVAWVAENRRRRALAFPQDPPNDPLFGVQDSSTPGPQVGQWALRAPETLDGRFTASATRLQQAWAASLGQGQVVAVLDTGTTAHEDLAGRLLPGRDFIADATVANDGGAVDSDASDPGDWTTLAEDAAPGGPLEGCGVFDSTWHGTHVASLLAASTNNGRGMAGGAPGAQILPVRVLGKCGGYDADIIAGLLWAAGVHQDGVPDNPHPARVLNLSLGGDGECSPAYRDALTRIAARGAVVVAAAGNSAGLPVGSPANCPGVIAVAGLRHEGDKVGYSNLGPEVTIAAPAGNCVNVEENSDCLFGLITASNRGLTTPNPAQDAYTNARQPAYGTSYAAPLVSATVALMLALRPDLTPEDVRRILQASARAFPAVAGSPACRAPDGTEQLACSCTTALCGAGMLDAQAAVAASMADTTGRDGGGAVPLPGLIALALLLLALRARAPRGR